MRDLGAYLDSAFKDFSVWVSRDFWVLRSFIKESSWDFSSSILKLIWSPFCLAGDPSRDSVCCWVFLEEFGARRGFLGVEYGPDWPCGPTSVGSSAYWVFKPFLIRCRRVFWLSDSWFDIYVA